MGGRNPFRVKADETDGGWGSMGGYMNAKIGKLNQQFNEDCGKLGQISNLFEGIAIHVNGYTDPTNDELKAMMAQHGGRFHAYYSSTSTTHIIASNLPRSKIKEIKPNQKVVKPEWIVDCLKEKKILPIQNYYTVRPQKSSVVGYIEKTSSDSSEPKVETAKKSRLSIAATSDDSFLSEFYSNSRLHHLSTWKSDLADFVRSLSEKNDFDLSGRTKLMEMTKQKNFQEAENITGKCIMHVDMDCFFVSVGLLSRPELVDKPVAVTHHSNSSAKHAPRSNVDLDYEKKWYEDKYHQQSSALTNHSSETSGINKNSVGKDDVALSVSDVSSCNYVARSRGLKNGMSFGRAKELCPDLTAIPYDFDAYNSISKQLYCILCSYTHIVEAVSCDEALLDVTSIVKYLKMHPLAIAEHIRNNIKEKTGCNASAGIGPNITLAKMATRVAKPNNQHFIDIDDVESFMADKDIMQLPGVGHATSSKLRAMGVNLCGDMQDLSIQVLSKEFGNKTGQKLFDLCRGIDKKEICQSKERKSFSVDINYGIRLSNFEETKVFFANLSKELSTRLEKAEMKGKKLTLKLMIRKEDAPVESIKYGGHGICNTMSRSKNLETFTNDCDVIAREAISLLKIKQVNVVDLRGVGIQITQLTPQSNPANQKHSLDSFLKPTKRKEIVKESNESTITNVSSNYGNTDSVKMENNSLQKENSCFLESLPDDLRKEVEANLLGQQQALLNRNMVHSKKTTAVRYNSPVKKRKKIIKQSPSKAKTVRVSNKNLSPSTATNSLITDLFKKVGKTKKKTKPLQSDLNIETAIDVKEEIEIQEDAMEEIEPPTLGDAKTVKESCNIMKTWVQCFNNSHPLDCDVNDVISYMLQLIESKNLTGLMSLIMVLKRSVGNLAKNTETLIEIKRHWIDVFNKILSTIQTDIEMNYDGASLSVAPLNF